MDEQWRTTPPQEVLEVQRIIDVACEACRKAENAGLLSRGRLRRAAARTVAEQSELLRRTAPWLKDAAIPGTYAGAAAYRDEASRITLDHVRKPFQERIDRLSGRLAGERFNQRFAGESAAVSVRCVAGIPWTPPYPSESDPVGGRSGLAGRGVGLRTRQRDAGVTRPHPQLVGVGAERAQELPPVPLVAPDLLVIAQHAVAGQNAAQLDEQVRPAPPRPRSANRRDGFPWWPP